VFVAQDREVQVRIVAMWTLRSSDMQASCDSSFTARRCEVNSHKSDPISNNNELWEECVVDGESKDGNQRMESGTKQKQAGQKCGWANHRHRRQATGGGSSRSAS
jgi:hypothetical protein